MTAMPGSGMCLSVRARFKRDIEFQTGFTLM